MAAPFVITADEVNYLIHSYFEDSGFQHSAFVLRAEGRLEQSPHFGKHIPRGELVELLSKALLYSEVEAHWKSRAVTANCTNPFSILEHHVCSLDPSLPPSISYEDALPPPAEANQSHHVNGKPDSTNKRKASTPSSEQTPAEKRAKTIPDDDTMDAESIASSSDAKPTRTKSPPAETDLPDATDENAKQEKIRKSGPADDTTDPGVVTLLKGHATEVFVCAWNPAIKNTLASGSRDTVIHIWNIPDHDSHSQLPLQSQIEPPLTVMYPRSSEQGDLTSLDWTRDGSLLAIGSYDATLRVCTAAGELYYTCKQHKGPIFATRFSKSGKWLLTASLDGTACVWDVKGKALHALFNCHDDCCLDVDWISDDVFASCGADGLIQIKGLQPSFVPQTLSGHSTEVNQVKCNPSRTRIASCSDDKTARIWDIEGVINSVPASGDVKILSGHTMTVSTIAWRPVTAPDEHEILATSSFDGTSRLWDTMTGDCLQIFHDHRHHVYALAFCPDGRFYATGGGDGWLHVYDVKAKTKRWSWYAGSEKPGIFEIDWQQFGNSNRMALALESRQVGVVDVSRIPLLR